MPWPVWRLAVVLVVLSGCRSEMYDQPRYEPYEASDFFDDGTLGAAAGRGHGPAPRSP